MKQRASGVSERLAKRHRRNEDSQQSRRLPCVVAAALCALCIPLSAQQQSLNTLPDKPQPQNQNQVATHPLPPTVSPDPQAGGSITGTIADTSGAAIPGATIRLSSEAPPQSLIAKVDSDGVFSFASLVAGQYRLLVSAAGFAPKIVLVSLGAGQLYTAPQIALMPSTRIDVEVGVTRTELADIQLDTEEKQRVLGIIPNFYVSYELHPVALTPKQKFKLAGRQFLDPVSFGITGLTAGIEQANNTYSGYGEGAAGYGKRYAAATGTFLDGVLIGNAILPSILKQDPRYFYKGTGSVKSRVLYAIAMSVVARGDNGHWQPNYSGILGGLAAGGIANAYYPAKDRDGLQLTFANAAIGTAGAAAGNIFQEFLVRRLTPHTGKPGPEAGRD